MHDIDPERRFVNLFGKFSPLCDTCPRGPFRIHRPCTALRAHPPAQLYSTLWSELWWEKYRLSALIYGTTWMTLEWTPCTSTWFLWGANDTTLHFRSVMFIWELLLLLMLADLLEDFQSVFLCNHIVNFQLFPQWDEDAPPSFKLSS